MEVLQGRTLPRPPAGERAERADLSAAGQELQRFPRRPQTGYRSATHAVDRGSDRHQLVARGDAIRRAAQTRDEAGAAPGGVGFCPRLRIGVSHTAGADDGRGRRGDERRHDPRGLNRPRALRRHHPRHRNRHGPPRALGRVQGGPENHHGALGRRDRDRGAGEDDCSAYDGRVSRRAPRPHRLGRRRHLRPVQNPADPGHTGGGARRAVGGRYAREVQTVDGEGVGGLV